MTFHVLTAITHVAGQVLGKWFDDPFIVEDGDKKSLFYANAKAAEDGLASLTVEEWKDVLESDFKSSSSALSWLRPALASRMISIDTLCSLAVRHFQNVYEAGAEIISIHSREYPPLLRFIARPPLLLTAVGNTDLLNLRHIAVIGSRKATYEALRMSVEVGMELASKGVGVVSGGAIGCDIAVHEGMLVSGQDDVNAIVVFAGGLSNLFPRCNARVFDEIIDRGGVCLSERLWFDGVQPRDFPARNRIVSGMSEAVAVMAAAERSGSLITAQEALEQGRDVHVFLPEGFQGDVRFLGSANLMMDGAYAFSDPHDLMQNLFSGPDEIYSNSLGVTRVSCQLDKTIGTFEREPNIYQ